jgi:hypothetical protein
VALGGLCSLLDRWTVTAIETWRLWKGRHSTHSASVTASCDDAAFNVSRTLLQAERVLRVQQLAKQTVGEEGLPR